MGGGGGGILKVNNNKIFYFRCKFCMLMQILPNTRWCFSIPKLIFFNFAFERKKERKIRQFWHVYLLLSLPFFSFPHFSLLPPRSPILKWIFVQSDTLVAYWSVKQTVVELGFQRIWRHHRHETQLSCSLKRGNKQLVNGLLESIKQKILFRFFVPLTSQRESRKLNSVTRGLKWKTRRTTFIPFFICFSIRLSNFILFGKFPFSQLKIYDNWVRVFDVLFYT